MQPKYEYTEGNHFKWGFGDEWYNNPDPKKQYKIHLGHIRRPVLSFREECVHAARLIGQKATKPILVGLSGGNDSQMVCLSLLEAKVPFEAVIVQLFDETWKHMNEEDNKTALAFCEKYDIEYDFFLVNLDYFYNDSALDYAEKYGFTQLHTIVQCAVMDKYCPDYYYIMAGGDIVMTPYPNVLTPELDQPKINNTEVPNAITVPVWWQTPQPIMQHMVEMGYEGTSKFFLYTPELIYAYLTHPVSSMFLDCQDVIFQTFTRWFPSPEDTWWRCYHTMYKPLMVRDQFPDTIPARKLTGFEEIERVESKTSPRKVMALYQKTVNAAAKNICGGQVIATPINTLINYVGLPHEHSLVSTKLVHSLYQVP